MVPQHAQRSFVLRIAVEERAPQLIDFQQKHLTEYLWPRTVEEFERLAESECLFEVIETTGGREDLVGLCYVMHGTEPEDEQTERAEFGGIYVTDSCRGLGIATALGLIAISNLFAWDPPRGRLIAHVHEDNQLPRGMLHHQLGFELVGQECPPPEVAPPSMKRNENGEVVGDVFEFRRSTLDQFADWIESFAEQVDAKAGSSTVRVDLPLMTKQRAEAIVALRDLAGA